MCLICLLGVQLVLYFTVMVFLFKRKELVIRKLIEYNQGHLV